MDGRKSKNTKNKSERTVGQIHHRKSFSLKRVNLLAVSIVLLFCTCIFFGVCKISGVQFYYMTTGSMERRIPKGSLIVSKKVDPAVLEVGDIITYENEDGILVTHEIVQKSKDVYGTEGVFQTKGTENLYPDLKLVTQTQIRGKVLFHIPIFS